MNVWDESEVHTKDYSTTHVFIQVGYFCKPLMSYYLVLCKETVDYVGPNITMATWKMKVTMNLNGHL